MSAPSRPGLGGPGLPCSTLRLRQLEAGELSGEARARAEAHLAHCARCQATRASFAEEREALARSLPFERFAAGVAGRLAAAPARRPRLARWVPLAAAAGLAVAVALPIALERRAGEGDRVKGLAAPGLTVYVRPADAARPGAAGGEREVRALAPGERVPEGGALRLGLSPGAFRHAAVALLDADGPALLYAGPARAGALPDAFEWTGPGEATLVLVLDGAPIDGAALVARLRRGGVGAAAPGPSATVVLRALQREGR